MNATEINIAYLLEGLRLTRECILNDDPDTADEILESIAMSLTIIECERQAESAVHH